MELNENTAYLSNAGEVISFMFRNRNIRFRGPYSLQKFEEIAEWNQGYLVVMARYQHTEEPIEEYIDLEPILEKLYINPKEFLAPITRVEVR